MRKIKVTEYSWALSRRGYGNISLNKEYNDLQGTVHTSHGIVKVYSQGDKSIRESTLLEFTWKGRCYARRINKRYSARYLVTLAIGFAHDIVAKVDGVTEEKEELRRKQ